MGRELRRVPLDFSAPLNEVWEGYISPDWRPCPDGCESGYTPAAEWMRAILGLLSVAAENSIEDMDHVVRSGQIYPHPYLDNLENRPGHWVYPPREPGMTREQHYSRGVYQRTTIRDSRLADLMDAIEATASPERAAKRRPRVEGQRDPMRYNITMDAYYAMKVLVEAVGMDFDEFAVCPGCKGHAIHPDDLEASNAWEGTDPPEGPGYQLWETTSEGSPTTSVFETIEELCDYAAANCTTFGSFKATAEEWRSMLDDGFVGVEMANPETGDRIVLM